MPEITEVLVTSHYLLTKIKNRYISKLNILSGRYTHQDIEGLDIFEKHLPAKIIDIKTKGKFMWMVLENKLKETIYLMCNFGLTGEWTFEKKQSTRLRFKIINKKSDKKYNLYFIDQRNFGIVAFTNKKEVLDAKLNNLARDYLQNPFTNKEFVDSVTEFCKKNKNKDKILVKFLMDQNANDTVGSGIGNYIAAESMYEAKLSPHRKIGSLSKKELETLNESIKKIIKISYIANKVGYMERLEDYIKKHQEQVKSGKFPDYLSEIKIKEGDEFEFKVYQKKEDPNGKKVLADKIITGRTTYWVPEVQK
jgi:formamidopyrimidine-DNA glycosylase